MKLTAEVDVEVPMVPNFILVGKGKMAIPIAEFDDGKLCQIAEAWKQALLTKARQRREGK